MSSSGAALTLAGLRDQLPITRHVAYLQTGGHSPTPESVLRTVHDEMAREAEFHGVPAVAAERAGKEARARAALATMLRVRPDELGITPSTSQAMLRVLHSLHWREGDEFVITNLEHVSVARNAWALRDQRGVRTKVVPADCGDTVLLERLAATLTERTKLLCISHLASPDGRLLPVAEARHWRANAEFQWWWMLPNRWGNSRWMYHRWGAISSSGRGISGCWGRWAWDLSGSRPTNYPRSSRRSSRMLTPGRRRALPLRRRARRGGPRGVRTTRR